MLMMRFMAIMMIITKIIVMCATVEYRNNYTHLKSDFNDSLLKG